MRLTFMTANVQNNPDLPHFKVVEIIKKLRSVKKRQLSVVFWQEIGEKTDMQAIKNHLRGFEHTTRRFGCPVSLRKKHWHIEDVEEVKFHDGETGFTMERGAIVVIARRKKRFGRLSKRRYALISFHFINGAWNEKFPETEARRQELWNLAFKILEKKVKDLISKDIIVFMGGDANRQRFRSFSPLQRNYWGPGIDKLCVIRPKGSTPPRELSKGRVKTWSDHDALWVSLGNLP